MYKFLSEMSLYNFCDKYYADEDGNVYFSNSEKNRASSINKKVKHFINRYGYVEYFITGADGNRKHIQAHRVVACLFIPNPLNKKYVNHIDGNKLNNTISNLEWVTASENELHSFRVLGKQSHNKGKELPRGREYKGKIRTVGKYSLEGQLIETFFNPTEAVEFGYDLARISAVCCGRSKTHKGFIWKYLEN